MSDQLQMEGANGAKPDQRILRLAGALNLVSVPGFLDAVRKEKAGMVVIDFAGVTLVDSAGVGSLIQTFVAFQNAGRKLALVGMSPRILAVLDITRVRTLLPVFESLADAEARLG